MTSRIVGTALCCLLAATAARADRVQVYSITGVDCVECANPIQAQLRKLKGVRKTEFDRQKVEMTVAMNDQVKDDAVLAAISAAGPTFRGTVGPGKGAYIPFGEYPKGSDAIVLTETGSAVGPLEKLRVPGKYTVFDLYADWCGPCREVDAQLRAIVGSRQDVAVRKLNVVDFKSPLAREMGARLTALPYLVVFTPGGKRQDFIGADKKRLAAALGGR
jgi:thioredoxin 1